MYKRRKYYVLGKAVMVVTGILLLNFMGISYAYWSEDLVINSSASMGKLDPKFGIGTELSVDNSRTQADFGELILYEDEEVEKSFNIQVNNEGTVPVKSDGVTIDQGGISIQIPEHEIEPERSANITLSIKATEGINAGDYIFDASQIKILYKQGVSNEGWEKELYISGKVVVKEPELEELELEELGTVLGAEEVLPETKESGAGETLPEALGEVPELEQKFTEEDNTTSEGEKVIQENEGTNPELKEPQSTTGKARLEGEEESEVKKETDPKAEKIQSETETQIQPEYKQQEEATDSMKLESGKGETEENLEGIMK